MFDIRFISFISFISFIFIIFIFPSSKLASGNDKNSSSSKAYKPRLFKGYPIPTPGRWYTYKCPLFPGQDDRIIRILYSLPNPIKGIKWIPKFTKSGKPRWDTGFQVLPFPIGTPSITLLETDFTERAIFLPSFDINEQVFQKVMTADSHLRFILNPRNPPECRLDIAKSHGLCVLEHNCHLNLIESRYNILWYDENLFPYE